MKKFYYFIIFCLFICTSIAKAQSIDPKVEALLAKAHYLTGNFKQSQTMPLLSKPLLSSGHFVLSKEKGLAWYQTVPFYSTFIVTGSEIRQQIEKAPPTIITIEQQPIVFSFTRLFLSVFKGDTQTIKEAFQIDFSGDSQKWNIQLTPLDPLLSKAIANIKLSGDHYIRHIAISQANHSLLEIELLNIKEPRDNA